MQNYITQETYGMSLHTYCRSSKILQPASKFWLDIPSSLMKTEQSSHVEMSVYIKSQSKQLDPSPW